MLQNYKTSNVISGKYGRSRNSIPDTTLLTPSCMQAVISLTNQLGSYDDQTDTNFNAINNVAIRDRLEFHWNRSVQPHVIRGR